MEKVKGSIGFWVHFIISVLLAAGAICLIYVSMNDFRSEEQKLEDSKSEARELRGYEGAVETARLVYSGAGGAAEIEEIYCIWINTTGQYYYQITYTQTAQEKVICFKYTSKSIERISEFEMEMATNGYIAGMVANGKGHPSYRFRDFELEVIMEDVLGD